MAAEPADLLAPNETGPSRVLAWLRKRAGLIAVFVLYTSPVVSHALARAALAGGFRPGARHVVLPDPSSPKSLPSGSGEGRAP